jgi:flavin-dependent dehydrogenase
MEKYDIVIIGGGFAGTSLAYKLSKLDSSLQVALIERSRLGGKPVSAFTFMDVIDDLGIKDAVKQYYNQIELISTLGAQESYTYDEDVFVLIDYQKACEELVNKSVCKTIFEEVKSIKGGKVALKDKVLCAKIIVDASGRGYKFRKELYLDVPKIENHLYFKKVIKCNIPNPRSVQLIIGDIGSNGGWLYPISNSECEIGVAERTNKLSRSEKANISNKQEKNMERLVDHSPYDEILKESRTESEAMVYYPYDPVKQVVKGNVMFLGDNAGMVHPMHGMGIHYINRIGTLCAKYCVQAARGNITLLREYQNAWNRMLKNDMDAWVQGMTYWSLNKKQLNKIMKIRSNSYVNKMNVLSELKGHSGNSCERDTFQVPLGLYLILVKHALIHKIKYKLKYRC